MASCGACQLVNEANMSGMWKQLFAEPPPDAMQHLLTPRRKFIYGMFAFAPGTLLAIYLSSVKRHMNEENEKLRLAHATDGLADEAARGQKDLVLMKMIEELRERIQELEREARGDTITQKANEVSKAHGQPATTATSLDSTTPLVPVEEKSNESPKRTELPSFLVEYEDILRPWLDRFDMLKVELVKLQEQLSAATTKDTASETERVGSPREQSGISPSGIRARIAERERDMRAQDFREHRQQASQSSKAA